jgi:subtilisin family serine protease
MNNNIGVAVLDTGIYKHIDFGNRIIAFKDFINNTNAVLSMVRCECIDYQCFIEAFKVNAFIYTVKLLSKLRDDDAFVCYDLCKNVYADIKLWNVMSNSKLLFRNKIQYIWYIDIVLACKLLNFR